MAAASHLGTTKNEAQALHSSTSFILFKRNPENVNSALSIDPGQLWPEFIGFSISSVWVVGKQLSAQTELELCRSLATLPDVWHFRNCNDKISEAAVGNKLPIQSCTMKRKLLSIKPYGSFSSYSSSKWQNHPLDCPRWEQISLNLYNRVQNVASFLLTSILNALSFNWYTKCTVCELSRGQT